MAEPGAAVTDAENAGGPNAPRWQCLRCPGRALDVRGPLEARCCGHCGGALVPPAGSHAFLEGELQLSQDVLRDLAKLFGGARSPCPACHTKMSPVRLRGALIDLCFGCGAFFVDAGELERMSAGRYSIPPPRAPVTAAVAHPQPFVRLDRRGAVAQRVGGSFISIGVLGAAAALAGLVSPFTAGLAVLALVAGAYVRRPHALDVFPRANRMVAWHGFVPPEVDDGDVHMPSQSVVCVRHSTRATLGALFSARAVRFDVVWVDDAGRELGCALVAGTAVQALRTSARLAQGLGVSVRTDLEPSADAPAALPAPSPVRTTHVFRLAVPSALDTRLVVLSDDGATVAELLPRVPGARAPAADSTASESAGAARALTPNAAAAGPTAPPTLKQLLDEGLRIVETQTATAVRLAYAASGERHDTLLFFEDGRTAGSVHFHRGLYVDRFVYSGPFGRPRIALELRHGDTLGSLVDGFGARRGELRVTRGTVATLMPVEVRVDPSAWPGDARFGLLALACLVSIAQRVREL